MFIGVVIYIFLLMLLHPLKFVHSCLPCVAVVAAVTVTLYYCLPCWFCCSSGYCCCCCCATAAAAACSVVAAPRLLNLNGAHVNHVLKWKNICNEKIFPFRLIISKSKFSTQIFSSSSFELKLEFFGVFTSVYNYFKQNSKSSCISSNFRVLLVKTWLFQVKLVKSL